MNFEKIKHFIFLTRLNKPIGILLLLWPTLWALWLASKGKPHFFMVVIFILGVVLMRSAGCVVNDLADRQFDGFVERTRLRPLATGKVTVVEALIVFLILLSCAFILVLSLNQLTILLALIGVGLTIFYPFLKRFTHLPQVGLGVAFAWGVPMAFAAQTNAIPFAAWILFLAAAIWPMIYDTLYAMVDRKDDRKVGIKSTAILFGKFDTIMIGILQFIFFILLVGVGFIFKLNIIYFSSLLGVVLLFIYQQILIKNRDPARCFQAFLNNQWVGLLLFCGIALS